MTDLSHLPAADRVERGLRDLSTGSWSAEAYWLAAAADRLRGLGLAIPPDVQPPAEPELALYAALSQEADPYSTYNAWRGELDSFVSALEARKRLERVAAGD